MRMSEQTSKNGNLEKLGTIRSDSYCFEAHLYELLPNLDKFYSRKVVSKFIICSCSSCICAIQEIHTKGFQKMIIIFLSLMSFSQLLLELDSVFCLLEENDICWDAKLTYSCN